MIYLELNWFFYDPSWTLQLSEFVWTLWYSVWVVFNYFLLIDATDKSKINSDQKRLFFPVLFANTPFNNFCNSNFSTFASQHFLLSNNQKMTKMLQNLLFFAKIVKLNYCFTFYWILLFLSKHVDSDCRNMSTPTVETCRLRQSRPLKWFWFKRYTLT